MKLLGNDYNEDIGHILKSIQRGDKLTIKKYPFQSEWNAKREDRVNSFFARRAKPPVRVLWGLLCLVMSV